MELRTLRRLKLRRGPQLTARGLGSLFRGGSLGRLISLELDSLALDDQALALLVKGCPHLQVLSLPWCWDITEAGLATIVNNCPNLESLVLLGLYKIHGFCLAGLAVSMPKLRYLHLEQCNEVVDLLLESLARRLPHLRVYNYYGELVGPLYESSGTPSLDMEASKDKEDSGADDRLLLLC
ncbi:F-box/leucine rich repeat protein, putative [Ixodes scapularis]|uniref:F-box/leucine rich repeat protein, putative n=1 Tax=Ixodes scapularis TaxID=6945 RepID=B7Q6R4_IXOSC|nr:F-box/leucine rich repeat protein, putative [Ixodes scapularis]|eukprot:XP_002403279.1 F-box/leucine rich repeat protein, putative [Ixodes scapularis]